MVLDGVRTRFSVHLMETDSNHTNLMKIWGSFVCNVSIY